MQHIKDGTYTWEAVRAFGPSTAYRVTVQGGRVTACAACGEEYPAATLARFGGELLEVLRAALEGRTRYGTSTVTFQPAPVPTIGKARAAKLHRIMGRAGLPSAAHYAHAARALGREVSSLAALTEGEARRVWGYLCAHVPAVRGAA